MKLLIPFLIVLVSATTSYAQETEGSHRDLGLVAYHAEVKLMTSVMAGGVAPVIDGINAAYTNTTGGLPGFLLEPFQGSTRPSAFINYILFDETYKPIEAKSTPVGSSAGVKQLIALPTIAVKESGYLFVYLSYDNESAQLVYFDDLTIKVTESPVVQVNNYYPYGLVAMEWVREGETDNNFLFQGKELIDQTGWHDFGARMYAGDLGRWFATDPANQFVNPFLSFINNPVLYNDPDGRIIPLLVIAGAGLAGGGLNLWSNWDKVKDFKTGLAYFTSGAAGGMVSLINPVAGGSITAGGNLIIDIATGNLPDLKNPLEATLYVGGLGLDALSAGTAGKMSHGIYNVAKNGFQRLGWVQTAKLIGEEAFDKATEVTTLKTIEITAKQVPIKNIVSATTANTLRTHTKTITHHIASNKHFTKYTSQFEEIAKKYKLELNQSWNKMEVSDVFHYSKHPNQYHEFVLEGMKAADTASAGNQANFLKLFDAYVKQHLSKNLNWLNLTGW